MRFTISLILVKLALVAAHTVIVYPGWRADNLITNSTFPYGMQWMYPCGGVPLTHNRTFWPLDGGAISFQPGWFPGHITSFLYINLGFGDEGPYGGPRNMSFPMVPPFQLLAPSNNPFPGTVCLPQVFPPANLTFKAGDNATIQVVETAQHGASLFSCVDITFVEGNDPRLAEVNETNCFNSSDFGFAALYTVTTTPPPSKKVTSEGSNSLNELLWIHQLRKYGFFTSLGWIPLIVTGFCLFI